jgi:hypothetical protein
MRMLRQQRLSCSELLSGSYSIYEVLVGLGRCGVTENPVVWAESLKGLVGACRFEPQTPDVSSRPANCCKIEIVFSPIPMSDDNVAQLPPSLRGVSPLYATVLQQGSRKQDYQILAGDAVERFK